jgi:hypothetical protein
MQHACSCTLESCGACVHHACTSTTHPPLHDAPAPERRLLKLLLPVPRQRHLRPLGASWRDGHAGVRRRQRRQGGLPRSQRRDNQGRAAAAGCGRCCYWAGEGAPASALEGCCWRRMRWLRSVWGVCREVLVDGQRGTPQMRGVVCGQTLPQKQQSSGRSRRSVAECHCHSTSQELKRLKIDHAKYFETHTYVLHTAAAG